MTRRRLLWGLGEAAVFFAHRRSFERGALVLVATSGLSYVLGLLRDRALAGTFGASDALDAYQASFIVPDFLFNLFVAAALSAAFIPVFTELRTQHREDDAARLAGTILTIGTGLLLVVGAIAFLFTDPLTALVAPGFSTEKRALLTQLTRLMLLSPLIFLVSNLLGSMLVSTRRFLFYGLSPALYNLGIISGALLFAPRFGILGVTFGTLLGALLHLFVRVVDARRAGLRLIPTVELSPQVRRMFVLMLPRIVGLTGIQAQLWAFTAIASTLGEGAVTIVNIARNFQSFPVSLVGIAFATSLFPLLAESASLRARSSYTRHLLRGALATLAVTVPAAALLFLFRRSLVAFFVGTGAFDPDAVLRTAAVLGVYTLSIPSESLAHVLARGFYALQNTLLPTLMSLLGIGLSITAGFLFAQRFGLVGIPAGFALGEGFHVLALAFLLRVWTRRAFA
ncbi:MAG: murein biosynthesis integral membrane protein MurJ [bacterium]|nr:murein biosynthesis integral membrane protein MurJ [bacterium]